MKMSRVLLADDHKIILDGLTSLLEPHYELVGAVGDGRALVKAADKSKPDVIVADISMPLLNGVEAARQIKQANHRIKIVFLTMHPDVTYAIRAFEAGASGYVLKHSASSELILAIQEVLQGKTYVTPMIAGELMESYRKGTHTKRDTLGRLTPRQREVLQLLAEGHTSKEVANTLNVSSRTVEFHKYKIMDELNIKTSAELVGYAIKHGLVSI